MAYAIVFEKHLEELKDFELYCYAWIVILYYKHKSPVSSETLIKNIKREKHALYRVIKKLEEKGYIRVERRRGFGNYYIPDVAFKRKTIKKTTQGEKENMGEDNAIKLYVLNDFYQFSAFLKEKGYKPNVDYETKERYDTGIVTYLFISKNKNLNLNELYENYKQEKQHGT